MRKVIRVLLALALVITCISAVSVQTKAAKVDGGSCGAKLTWAIADDGTLTISGTGAMNHYDETYAPWLGYAEYITKVVIKSGVTSIGKYAFLGCQYIPSVTLPKTVTSIGEGAFMYCLSMESITIPSSVKTIGDGAFMYCTKLKSAKIPSGVKTVGDSTFYACTVMESVTLPSSITTISDWAFAHCDGLTTVTIPKNVSAIGKYAFCNCDSLTKIKVSSDNKYYSSDSKGVLFNKNKTTLLQAPGSLAGKYTIPNSVKTIDDAAFYNCWKMTAVTISNQVTAIGNEVFAYSAIASVSIPESVTSIGEKAFYSCSSLRSVSIPKKVTTIGEYAFSECADLTSVTIPGSLTTLSAYAFSNCYKLSSVTIFHGVENIGQKAFMGAEEMTYLFIPASVKTVGENAFRYMPDLNQVSYGGTQEQWAAIAFGEYNGALTDNTILYRQFPDVKPSAWYYNAVEFAVEKGYFSGHGNGNFAPTDPITRQDFVLVLSRIAGADLTGYTGETAFTDVKPNAYYAKAIQWATENGIIGGYNPTTFGVGDKLTREQLVTIMYRYANKLGVDVTVTTGWDLMNEYPDATAPNPNLREMVAWALEKGIISGKQVDGKTCIAPQASATRAETAQILLNISTKGLIPGI